MAAYLFPGFQNLLSKRHLLVVEAVQLHPIILRLQKPQSRDHAVRHLVLLRPILDGTCKGTHPVTRLHGVAALLRGCGEGQASTWSQVGFQIERRGGRIVGRPWSVVIFI